MGFLEIMRAKRLSEISLETEGEPPEGPPGTERQILSEPPHGDRKSGDSAQGRPSGFRMLSNVFNGEVDVVFPDVNPDTVLVGDVIYQTGEVQNLLLRNLAPEDLRAVHEIKRVFEGSLCIYV